MRLVVDATKAGLSITSRWPAGARPPQLLAIVELVFWAALTRIATRHAVRPTRVTVPELPPDRDALADFFGLRMQKGGAFAITFAAGDAGRPFLTENDEMWRFFAPELRRRLSDLGEAATVTDRVRAALLETLPAGDSSISAVTRQLGDELAHPPASAARRRHVLPGSPDQDARGPRPPLSRHRLDANGRDRVPLGL